MLRVATIMRTSSGYHSHRSGEQVIPTLLFFLCFSSRIVIYAEENVTVFVKFRDKSRVVRSNIHFATAHDLVATFDRLSVRMHIRLERTKTSSSFAPVLLTFAFLFPNKHPYISLEYTY